MKVRYGDNTYLVHFETRKHDSLKHDKELAEVSCVIRGEDNEILTVETVNQHYRDPCNMVFARKLAFSKAVSRFTVSKKARTAFWETFKKECRYKV